MVSIKLKFRPSSIEGKEGSLYYQVIYKRFVRQISTQYKIYPIEWDVDSDTLIVDAEDCDRYDYLQTIQRHIQWDKKRLMRIIHDKLNFGNSFSSDSIVKIFNNEMNDITLFDYIERLIDKLQKTKVFKYICKITLTQTMQSFHLSR